MELYKHNYTRRHREKGRKLHLLVERQWMVTTNVLCWQLKHREQPCQRYWGFLKWWTIFGKVPEETKCNLTWICRVAVSLKILVGAKKKKLFLCLYVRWSLVWAQIIVTNFSSVVCLAGHSDWRRSTPVASDSSGERGSQRSRSGARPPGSVTPKSHPTFLKALLGG